MVLFQILLVVVSLGSKYNVHFPIKFRNQFAYFCTSMMPCENSALKTFNWTCTLGSFSHHLYAPQRDTWTIPCRMAIHLFMPFVGKQFPFWETDRGSAFQIHSRHFPSIFDHRVVRKQRGEWLLRGTEMAFVGNNAVGTWPKCSLNWKRRWCSFKSS